MNGTLYAIKIGAKRGWHEQVLSLKSTQDQTFYLFFAVVTLVYMYVNRNNTIDGLDLTIPQVALPTIVAAAVTFGLIVGPAQQIAMEREDGTVLRVLSAPRGSIAYATGHFVLNVTSLLPTLAVIMLPSVFLFDAGSQRGWSGWAAAFGVLVLAFLALLPVGLVIGTLVPDVRRTTTWGILPLLFMMAVSGIFVPLSNLWGWLQAVGQGLPLYWFAHGMRFAFLPEGAAELELHGEWRISMAVVALALWAIVAWTIAVATMRRVGSGVSAASVVTARDTTAQWVR